VRLRPHAVLPVLAVSAALLAGCSAGASDGSELRLIVRDASLREVGADCSGAARYLFIHKGAELVATDSEGTEALRRELPAGTAIKADDLDYGKAERIPTLCSFTLDAPGLVEGETYTFTVDGTEVGEQAFEPGDDDVATLPVPALGDPSLLEK